MCLRKVGLKLNGILTSKLFMIELVALVASVAVVGKIIQVSAYQNKTKKIRGNLDIGEPIRIFEPDDVNTRFGTEVYSRAALNDALANIKCCTVHTDYSRYRHGSYEHPMDAYALQFQFQQEPYFPAPNDIRFVH